MIDSYQRKASTPCERSGEPDSDQKGADETRARCHSDQLDRPAHSFQCLIHEVWQGLEVFARGKLWNNAPIGLMRRDLAGQQAHLDPSIAINNRDGALVTRCLDTYGP